MQDFLINLSTHHTVLVYVVAILIAIVEGPVISMIFGVLIKLGYFSFFLTYFVLMLGDVISDSILYAVGYKFGYSFVSKYGKYININEKSIERGKRIYHKFSSPILIVSKMTNGLGLSFVVLLTAGITKIPFWKYFTLNLIGQFIWSGLLIGIGYFFSTEYMKINNIGGKVFLVVIFIAILAGFIGFIKYLRKKSERI